MILKIVRVMLWIRLSWLVRGLLGSYGQSFRDTEDMRDVVNNVFEDLIAKINYKSICIKNVWAAFPQSSFISILK